MTPTHRVEHVVEQCSDCGTQLSGGWAQRTREVIELPQVPAQVTEHVYLTRTGPRCRRCCVPKAQLDGVVMGKQRLGINVISLIAVLREEARLPLRTIQWHLDTVHGLQLSLGAIVAATPQVAGQAQRVVADILEQVRGSPVVHADETGWRQDGHNGYVWTFSTPNQRYFRRRNRGKAVVDEVLGDDFAGVLVSDFSPPTTTMRVPNNAAGPTCCGTSTTCDHSTQLMDRCPSGLTPSTNSTVRPRSLPTPQSNNAAPPKWPWKDDCWSSAGPTWMTRRRSRPGCADA